jgi:hypothetical protein
VTKKTRRQDRESTAERAARRAEASAARARQRTERLRTTTSDPIQAPVPAGPNPAPAPPSVSVPAPPKLRELRETMRGVDERIRAAMSHASDPHSLRESRAMELVDQIRQVMRDAERLDRDVARLQQHLVETMRTAGPGSGADLRARTGLDRYITTAMGRHATRPDISAAVADIRTWAESRERQIGEWAAGGWVPPAWSPRPRADLPVDDNSWWRERP